VVKISTLLNIIGIALILLSIIFIILTSRKEKNIYKEISKMHEDVKNYYDSLESVANDFDELIENSLNKVEKIQDNYIEIENRKTNGIVEELKPFSTDVLVKKNIIGNNIKKETKDGIYEKIIELKKLGLSNREIAQKLKIGIREVEIIISMMEKL